MIKKNCLNCNNIFSVNNYRKNIAKFCTRDCADKFWKGKRKSQYGFPKGHIPWSKLNPKLCKSNSGSFKKGQVSLRKGKRYLAIMGSKNPNWKNGITSLNKLIRSLPEMRKWKQDLFKLGNWTCYLCGKYGGNLHIDHYPIQFALILERNFITSIEQAINCKELWDIKNGRILCVECHKKTDTYMKKLSIN